MREISVISWRASPTLSRGRRFVEPDDVVLAEIASGLDLDQLERDLAGIGEPVDRADRDIDRLVLVHELLLSPIVTSAVPRTTTQCSARCMCFCSDSVPPG